MRQPTIITILLVTVVSCDSSISPNQSPIALFTSKQSSPNILSSAPNDPLYAQQGYLQTTNVPQAWQTTTGSSSREIAIIGMGGINNNHEDLNARVKVKTTGPGVGATNPVAGIIGAATNNGKGIAGVNWSAPVYSYNIAKNTTKTVTKLDNGVPITLTFADLDQSAVAPAINDAVNSGARTIYLPLNWVQGSHIPELVLSDLQVYPCCKVENPWRLIYTNVKNIINSIIAGSKENNNYIAAINAVKNAYKGGTVVVGKALEYNGVGVGFPANLSSDHVVFTVGAYNTSRQSPYQYSGTPESDEVSADPNDINLIAPGVDLQTTLEGNQEYGMVSGTGASAALGAGIVSLLQSAEGDLTPDDIRHIFEKTAAPVGGAGYDEQSGYGLIDAGAAMNYVQNHDIKHGMATNGQIEQIFSNRLMTFVSSAWSEVASGAYYVDEYEVTYTIPLVPSADNDLWFNAKGTYGWTPANPNDQNRYAKVELLNDHATVTTYIYHMYDTAGNEVGWHPASPDNIQLSYSYVGEFPPEPLSVSVGGPQVITTGGNYTWEANVEYGNGGYSYQWQYSLSLGGPWTTIGSTKTYTRFVTKSDQLQIFYLRVIVTSGSEQASAIRNVAVTANDCPPGQICPQSNQSESDQKITVSY